MTDDNAGIVLTLSPRTNCPIYNGGDKKVARGNWSSCFSLISLFSIQFHVIGRHFLPEILFRGHSAWSFRVSIRRVCVRVCVCARACVTLILKASGSLINFYAKHAPERRIHWILWFVKLIRNSSYHRQIEFYTCKRGLQILNCRVHARDSRLR